MEYYLIGKINEVASNEEIGKNLKCILWSKRSQYEKATYCIIITIWHSGKDKAMETVKKRWGGELPGNKGILRAAKLLQMIP